MNHKDIAIKILVNPSPAFRIIRYSLLWISAILLIFRGFRFIATTIPESTSQVILQYTMYSTIFIGCLIISSFWVISHLIHRYLLTYFKLDYFLFYLLAIHLLVSELVLFHFRLFYFLFPLNQLPRFYITSADHINHLSFWQAPFDNIIVWLFCFSLFYNYLLYALGLKVFKDLFTIQLRKTELEKENLILEFDFLKAQLNPHFLFNTLNNIYSFSIRSPEKVSDSILKLSDMMRYTLYETNEEHVLLKKEVTFLTSYIDLQRIRHDEHVSIRFVVNGQATAQIVHPLLFIVFIENAFKHGIQSTSEPSWVEINIFITPFSITLSVNNSIPTLGVSSSGGIGLNNVQKRLAYFYPEQYNLVIQQTDKQFSINLYLDLYERGLPSNRVR